MEKITKYMNLIKQIYYIYCDDCESELDPTGMVYMTYPQQYEYRCPQCQKVITTTTYYPWSEIIGTEVTKDINGNEVCISI